MTTIRGVGVAYDAISRSRGDGVLARSRYQREFAWRADKKPENADLEDRQWLLWPESAPEWAMDPDILWKNAADACKRPDAQEGRYFDFVWPRELPEDAVKEAVPLIYGCFKAMGLPVQINFHTKLASDGLPNGHVHGMIGARFLDENGFGQVCRGLAEWFHEAGGKRARNLVASVLNQVAVNQGANVHFDPRSNQERGLPLPEDRLPRSYIRHPDTPAAKEALARQDTQRKLRREHAAVLAQIEQLEAQQQSLLDELDHILEGVLVFVPADGNAGNQGRLSARDLAELAANDSFDIGAPVDLGPNGVAIPVDGGAVVDTGAQLLMEGPMSSAKARVMLECARRKGWNGVRCHSQPNLDSYLNNHASQSTFATGRSGKKNPAPAFARPGILALIERLKAEGSDSDILLRLYEIARAENHDSTANILRRLQMLELGVTSAPTEDDVISLVNAEHPAADGASTWLRWVTLQDFAAMMNSSNPLGAVVAGQPWRPGMKASVHGPAP